VCILIWADRRVPKGDDVLADDSEVPDHLLECIWDPIEFTEHTLNGVFALKSRGHKGPPVLHTPHVDLSSFPPEAHIRLQRHKYAWQVSYPGAHDPASEQWSWDGPGSSAHRVADETQALLKCSAFCWKWHSKLHEACAAT
jgi:hypothetical protein